MKFPYEKVKANVEASSTEDLLNRVTVYRQGMEPEALVIIEAELRSRGIREEAIESHHDSYDGQVLLHRDGLPARCSQCHNPAILQIWDWHRMWGKLPLFPKLIYYCYEHSPDQGQLRKEEDELQ